jgi:branched-subunit amino acid transport protein
MAIELSALELWGVVLLILAGTLAARLSFVVLFGRLSGVPRWLERLLTLVPPAALAALVVPSFVVADGGLALSAGNERLLAGALAALVAWRTENLLATVAAGMAVLWVARFLV